MMVHSRVRCFQSLPAPSQAIEADHCHCKPVPSRNGDMGHLTKGILAPGVNEKPAPGREGFRARLPRIKSIKTGAPKRRLARDSYRRLVGSLSVQPRRRFSSVSQPSSRAFSVAAALAMRVNSWEVTRVLRSSWPKPLRKHRPRVSNQTLFRGRAGHLHDYPTKGLLYLDLKIGNLGHGCTFMAPNFNAGSGASSACWGPPTLFQTV